MGLFNPTALYGKHFVATQKPDVYFLRVYTGGFAGVKTATNRAMKEAAIFLKGSEYSEFTILETKRVLVPLSCVEFLVSFGGRPTDQQPAQI